MKRFFNFMKTEIRIETHELTVIRVRQSQSVTVFCPFCELQALHLTVARATAVLQISETAVFRLVEGGTVHSIETRSGTLLVCSNSAAALAKGKAGYWRRKMIVVAMVLQMRNAVLPERRRNRNFLPGRRQSRRFRERLLPAGRSGILFLILPFEIFKNRWLLKRGFENC